MANGARQALQSPSQHLTWGQENSVIFVDERFFQNDSVLTGSLQTYGELTWLEAGIIFVKWGPPAKTIERKLENLVSRNVTEHGHVIQLMSPGLSQRGYLTSHSIWVGKLNYVRLPRQQVTKTFAA